MNVSRDSRVFFDASCVIAAAGSTSGGSAFVLSKCRRGLLLGAISQPVVLEAEGNIAAKLGPEVLSRFHRLLVETPLLVAPVPDSAARESFRLIAGTTDDHVVASAVAVHAPYRLTLDRCLREGINAAALVVRAYTPGEFITGILPAHAEFSDLRDDSPSR